MKLYLDDDTASELLAKLLRRAGHDTQLPSEHVNQAETEGELKGLQRSVLRLGRDQAPAF